LCDPKPQECCIAIPLYLQLYFRKPDEFIGEIQRKTTLFRDGMTAAGFTIMGQSHPISPVYIGDARPAADLANMLLDHGIYVTAFSFPVVPEVIDFPEKIFKNFSKFSEVKKIILG